MTYYEIINHLKQQARKYRFNEFNLFASEIGWEDWMNDYLDNPEEEQISESESEAIDKILREAWDIVFSGDESTNFKKESDNSIRNIVDISGMSQAKFAQYFGIPKRTIEDWCSGKHLPPEYVVNLIRYKLVKEGIIEGGVIIMRKYLSISVGYNYKNNCERGDEFIEYFNTLEEANDYAEKDWKHLTASEKAKNRVYVAYVENTSDFYDITDIDDEDFSWSDFCALGKPEGAFDSINLSND